MSATASPTMHRSRASGRWPAAASPSKSELDVRQDEAAGTLELIGLHFGIAEGILRKLTSAPRFEPLS